MVFFVPGILATEAAAYEGTEDPFLENPDALMIYCGAGLKKPMQDIGDTFTNSTGIPVVFNFQGSGALLTQMEITHKGDIYVPGGTPDYQKAQEKELVGDPEYLAYHVPVVAVMKGNPLSITDITDFTRPGLRIGLGDTKATAIGGAGEKLFLKLGILEDVSKNVVVRTATINELVTAMKSGSLDASLLTMDQIDKETMDAIPLKNAVDTVLIIPIGVTTFSKNPENAGRFVNFTSSEDGKAFFESYGFPSYPDEAYQDVKP